MPNLVALGLTLSADVRCPKFGSAGASPLGWGMADPWKRTHPACMGYHAELIDVGQTVGSYVRYGDPNGPLESSI